jgi:hypothetical protein
MPDPLERLKTALADRYTIEGELGRGAMPKGVTQGQRND